MTDLFEQFGIDPAAAAEPAASASDPVDLFAKFDIDVGPTAGEQAGGLALGGLKGAMRSVKWVPDLVQMIAPNPATQAASDFFQRGIEAADQLTPEAYRLQQGRPIFYEDEQGNLGWQLPSLGQTAGVITESLPQIPSMLVAGGGAARGLQGLGLAKGAAQAAGYGAANSAMVTPLQHDEVLREAIAEGQRQGLTGEALEQYANERANALAQIVGPLSFATGAAGLGLAARLGEGSGNALAGFAKGVAADAPFEAIEEGGQNVAADVAMRRPVDATGALNAGAMGALAGGVTGGALGAVSSGPAVDTSRDTRGGHELGLLLEDEISRTALADDAEAQALQSLDLSHAQQHQDGQPQGLDLSGNGLVLPGQPVANEQTSNLDLAAHEAATSPNNDLPEPTQAQKEAGNYKKGRIRVQGMDISIENPRGSERSGTGPDGAEWRHTMSDHYGYIKRTTGADGEQVDVYIGPQPDSGQVIVVDQLNQQDGSFDEHKVMLGYPDQASAIAAYRANFDDGWQVGSVTAMPVDQFKAWLKEGDLSGPLAQKQPEAPAALTQGLALPGQIPSTAPAPLAVEPSSGEGAPVVPPRTPPVAPPTIGRQSKVPPRGQRRSVDRDRDSVVQAAIRLGGITTQWKQDTTGDTKGNRHIPGVGALWSDKTGTSLDDMASLLDQHGYVPAGEMDKDGGVSWLQDSIRDELAGSPRYAPDSAKQIELAEQELLNRYAEAVARAIDEREAEYARIEAEYGPDAAADARSFDEAAIAYNEQLDGALEDGREAQDTLIDGESVDQADAARRDDELRQADGRADRAEGENAGEAFGLEQQTEAGLAEQDRQRQSREKAEEEARRQAEQKAQADAAVGDFTLTGSDRPADVGAARGQDDMFAPSARSEKGAADSTTSDKPTSIAEALASMDLDELAAMVDSVVEEKAAPQTSQPKTKRSRKATTATGKTRPRPQASKAEVTNTANPDDVKRTAGQIAKSLGGNLSDASLNALEGLTQLFGGPGRLSSGLSFDEETYAKAKPHFRQVMSDLEAAGKDVRDLLVALVQAFGDGVKPYILRFAQDLKEEQQGGRTDQRVEPDSAEDGGRGAGAHLRDDQPGAGGRSAEPLGNDQDGKQRPDAGAVDGGNGAAAQGERGNQGVGGQEPGVGTGTAGSADGRGGRDPGASGLSAERTTDGAADHATAAAVATEQAGKASVKSSNKPGTLAEIKAQLPFLTDGQAADVVFAEQRLMKPAGYGVLYTNGTGTGKTFTGLGIMARAAARGKDSILVVVPKQTIADAWVKAGERFFGLAIKGLESTQDNGGSGVVVTTYTNVGANASLARRSWDMVVADEAHYLSSAEDGATTAALENLRALARRRGYASDLVNLREREKVERLASLSKSLDDRDKEIRDSGGNAVVDLRELEADRQERDALRSELDALYEQEKAAFATLKPEDKPRAVFLSATPFAYEKNVQWAQEFLFDWGSDRDSSAYNAGGNYEQFMIQHFGYRMRYNKLTEPDAKVDRGLMQRAFNSWLKREGALSARALDSDFDYDRRFVTVESPIGQRVDQALKWLRLRSSGKDLDGNDLGLSATERGAFYDLEQRIAKDSFDYLSRMYFLEAIKAREALPHIRAQLAAGRKVLVMHDFKQGGVANPFVQRFGNEQTQAAYQRFADEFADLIREFSYLPSPIAQLKQAFPDALVYNGSVSPKQRIAMQDRFNDDADDAPRLIIAQGDAMREGVSIHDTTGKFPRVLVHLGMPVKPTAAIQQEGRIYRTGQASDALFRYFTIGTAWERSAFASKIASRAGAAENLAMGEQARGLKQAFIDAYESADLYEPGFAGEGTGGKAADLAMAAALTPWDMAKSFYFGTKKQGAGRSARGREGLDYFATPEPVGLKMVEWADLRAGERALEPSAGHGAIARWFPDAAKVRVIEQSAELASRVALHVDGDVVHGRFEDHHIVNKYDAIVMNPPFGQGGATAIAHLSKAADHLADGGRVVALIPTGPAADKRFDNWLYGQDQDGKALHADLHLIANVTLPAVTFERAGTSVATRIVVIEKLAGDNDARLPASQIDLSGIDDIAALFDRLENLTIRPREKAVSEEQAQTAPGRSLEAKPKPLDAKAKKQSYVEQLAAMTDKYVSAEPIVTHTTRKGDTLRGVIVRDLSVAQVKAKYYEYAFAKDGGVFLREEFVARPGATQYRIGAGAGVKADEVRAALAAAPELAGIQVVQSFADLPLSVRIRAARDGVAPGDMRGVFRPDGQYLVADNLDSLDDAVHTAVHEMVGHFGVRGVLGRELDAALERIYSSEAASATGRQRIAQIREVYAEPLKRRSPADQRLFVAEEIVAHLAESGDRPTALQRFVSKVRAVLRRLFPQVRWTYNDILALIGQSRAWLRRQDGKAAAAGEQHYALVAPVAAADAEAPPSQGRLSTSAAQEETSLELPAETVPRRLQRTWQDKLNRFTVLKEWLAERGVTLSEQADVYKAEERMHSRFANKAKDFREGTVRPLVEKIQQAGFSMEEVAQYLHAQHAQERNAQIARINKQMPDGGAGMSNAEARAILAAADPKLARLANEFRAITDRTRQVLLDAGLIDKEMAGAWQKAYQHYVPLKGGPDGQAARAGTGKGLSVKHKAKRALGHQVREEGEWIIENIIADHERALMVAEKNLVGRHLLRMAMDVGMDEIMTVGKPEKRGVLQNRTSYEVLYQGRPIGAFETLEGARTFKAAAPLSMKKSTLSDFTIRQSNDPSVVYMASPMPAPNEALVYVDGKVIRIQINDDLLARAYNNLGVDALGTFMSVGRALNRWFSTVYTGYNPEFLVTNVIRDFTTGLANVTGEEGALFAAKAAKNYFASFGALLRYARKGTADQWIRQYREDGGNTGAAYLSDLERLGTDVQSEYAAYQGVLANLRKGSLKGAARAAGRRALNATLRHIEAWNEAGENAMRLALYRTAVEQGMTRNRAASLAKNTTVNFNRKGELGAQANALWLFFNAGVQGTASLAHAHFKGQHKRQAWALSGAMAALGYSLALLTAGDDEDEYEKTPDHVKARNLVIPLGAGQSLTIPIPYGYGFFFNFGRLLADAQRTGETDGMAWKLAASFAGEFTPFSGAVAGDEPELAQAGIFLMPTVAQIPLSIAFNRTSFGGPMYPENSFKEFEPDRLKMWRGTEGTWADSLAGALEGVGMDVSPETLKYLNRTFTGGAGNFVGSTVDAAALGAQGAAPEAREIPFLRKFYRENGVGDARARFWRYQAKAKKAAEELERAIDAGDRSRVQALVGENRELIAMAEVAQAFSEASGAVRDRVQEIRLGDLPVAEQREQIRRIEQRETELYDRFIGIFKARVQAQ